MRILVTGIDGQLGHDIVEQIKALQYDYLALNRKMCDISDFAQVSLIFKEYKPTVVIHCAAYTLVDEAEKNVQLCRIVNTDATKYIAEVCKEIDAELVYFSTDYVFSGKTQLPYEVDSVTEPINVYGRSKLDGEIAIKKLMDKYYIIRTSWLFGHKGENFVKKIIQYLAEKKEISVVCDQIGSPTYTIDLANVIIKMIINKKYGTYHITNEGFCSWSEFASEIKNLVGSKTIVKSVSSDEYPSIAKRPKNSKLSKSSLTENGLERLPSWQDALNRFVKTTVQVRKDDDAIH